MHAVVYLGLTQLWIVTFTIFFFLRKLLIVVKKTTERTASFIARPLAYGRYKSNGRNASRVAIKKGP